VLPRPRRINSGDSCGRHWLRYDGLKKVLRGLTTLDQIEGLDSD
jgi:hypothetical protein